MEKADSSAIASGFQKFRPRIDLCVGWAPTSEISEQCWWDFTSLLIYQSTNVQCILICGCACVYCCTVVSTSVLPVIFFQSEQLLSEIRSTFPHQPSPELPFQQEIIPVCPSRRTEKSHDGLCGSLSIDFRAWAPAWRTPSLSVQVHSSAVVLPARAESMITWRSEHSSLTF